jgi:hypothetical protein
MLPSTLSVHGNAAVDELKEPGELPSAALLSRALLHFYLMLDISCAHVRSCPNVSQIILMDKRLR